jgi:hypothetical protein
VVGDVLRGFMLPLFFRYAVMPVARKVWFPILVLMPASTARQPIMRYMSAWTHDDYAGVPARVEVPWTPAFDRIKTVSKRDSFS